MSCTKNELNCLNTVLDCGKIKFPLETHVIL